MKFSTVILPIVFAQLSNACLGGGGMGLGLPGLGGGSECCGQSIPPPPPMIAPGCGVPANPCASHQMQGAPQMIGGSSQSSYPSPPLGQGAFVSGPKLSGYAPANSVYVAPANGPSPSAAAYQSPPSTATFNVPPAAASPSAASTYTTGK
uniref:VM domain-containing protein n=1 Tax=Rhabditophanes sp. KR3021 TaxID=114890 RepID=A0AC35TZQ9_9BILA